MKIRIRGNSLRLRLAQSEIYNLKDEGRVSDSIDFGTKKLIYTLQVSEGSSVMATYEGDFITVFVPVQLAEVWLNSDQVGFEAHQPLHEQNDLFILVEKDFQCIKPRLGEDESDLYQNPSDEH